MAEDVCEGLENTLNLIVSTAERSSNMKKELGRVASMKADLEASRGFMIKVHRETSSSPTQEPARVTAKAVDLPGGGGRKLFSAVLANGCNAKRFTMTVTSKDNQTSEKIKEILKININPTAIKVGINALKTLRNGKVIIETNTKEELETLGKDINNKCGDRLETHTHKMRNPRLVILNIPDDITTSNIEETLIAQNPGLFWPMETSMLSSFMQQKNTPGTLNWR